MVLNKHLRGISSIIIITCVPCAKNEKKKDPGSRGAEKYSLNNKRETSHHCIVTAHPKTVQYANKKAQAPTLIACYDYEATVTLNLMSRLDVCLFDASGDKNLSHEASRSA